MQSNAIQMNKVDYYMQIRVSLIHGHLGGALT